MIASRRNDIYIIVAITLIPIMAITIFLTIANATDYIAETPNSIQSYESSSGGIVTQATTSLDGTFSGTIAIAEPLALGTFDLVVDLSSTGNSLVGSVDASRTQAVSGTVPLQGSITGTSSAGMPTFRVATTPFSEDVGGRSVIRSFEIVGEVTPEGRLQGTYTETTTGFTPKPLISKGAFLLVRSFKIQNGPGEGPLPSTHTISLPLVRR